MQFNNVTDKNGIIQNCEIALFGDSPFTQISGNTSRLAIFTNYVNEGLSRYAQLALMSDYNWEWDDQNQTDLPIGTTTITSGQQDYSIATEHIIVTGIEIKNPLYILCISCICILARSCCCKKERYFTENDISISNYMNNVAGLPYQYTKVANSIFLYPTPNFTQAASLKVHFKRAPSYYTSADTTKVQGFTNLHANYLVDYACWKYASSPSRSMTAIANILRQEIQLWEEIKIPDLYSKRSAEHSKILIPKYRYSR